MVFGGHVIEDLVYNGSGGELNISQNTIACDLSCDS